MLNVIRSLKQTTLKQMNAHEHSGNSILAAYIVVFLSSPLPVSCTHNFGKTCYI